MDKRMDNIIKPIGGNWGDKWDKALSQLHYKPAPIKHCHRGNIRLLEWHNGAGIYAGGWTRGANPMDDWAVIDLSERAEVCYANHTLAQHSFPATLRGTQKNNFITLHMPIRDFDIPRWPESVWSFLASDVYALLERGINVLIACDGGHGRTGMIAAILVTLLCRDERTLPDPIAWIRKVYCENAIETTPQELYVYNTLGLDRPVQYTHDPILPLDDFLLQEEIIDLDDWNEDHDGLCDTCGTPDMLNEYNICMYCWPDVRTDNPNQMPLPLDF